MAAGTYKSRAALATSNEFIAAVGVALGGAAETIISGTDRVAADNLSLAYNVRRDTANYERRMSRMVAESVVITIGAGYDSDAPTMPTDGDILYAVTTLFNLL